jgi:hypothetical protein
MPNIVGPETIDTPSTDGNCLYPEKKLGGTPYVSPNVKMEGEEVKLYNSLNLPASVDGVKINPAIPLPCQPGIRRIEPVINDSVLINGQLFAVTGDEADLLTGATTPRPLTGPYSYPTIQIGTQKALENS